MTNHGESIQKAMEVRNMTQGKLVQLTGIDKATISQIISRERRLTVKNAKRIEKALRVVSARDLLIAQVEWELGK